MHVLADTTQLVRDGVLTRDQAQQLEVRARDTMIALAINALLAGGILAATLGLIFWLKDATVVAGCGALLLALGAAILRMGKWQTAMFGQAAVLIGAGLLIGGFGVEMGLHHPDAAGWATLLAGAVVALAAFALYRRGRHRFIIGAVLLMGVGLHLFGAGFLTVEAGLSGWPKALVLLYAAGVIAGAGLVVDIRLVTALAVLPFAQMLDTGTAYWHAVYAFYSPEPALSILQLSLLIAPMLWLHRHRPVRLGRHAMVLAVLGFIIANLCALVGALWGDVVGETIWGPARPARWDGAQSWESYQAARDAFRATALRISEEAFAIFWAVALALIAAYAAHRALRGLFNTALTFAALHAYTQLFESFGDQPLAFVIGGLGAIPIAWGIWRLNAWLSLRRA